MREDCRRGGGSEDFEGCLPAVYTAGSNHPGLRPVGVSEHSIFAGWATEVIARSENSTLELGQWRWV
jgi:hypothetical protein